MKAILSALTLVLAATIFAGQANADSRAVASGCYLTSRITEDKSVMMAVFSVTDFKARGTVYCTTVTGENIWQNVSVTVKGAGPALGIALPRNNAKFNVVALDAGIIKPSDMLGMYRISAGPGATLFGARYGAEANAAVTTGKSVVPAGVQASVSVSKRQMIGLGLDLSGALMAIEPLND